MMLQAVLKTYAYALHLKGDKELRALGPIIIIILPCCRAIVVKLAKISAQAIRITSPVGWRSSIIASSFCKNIKCPPAVGERRTEGKANDSR